jgi:type IV pilus assembly protein PilM
MLGLGKAKKALVGLDIGSSSIKAVQLRKKGRQIELAALGLAELGPDAVVDGAIMDTPGVSSAIQKIFNENAIETQSVATSVSGTAVIVKRINVAANSEADLPTVIPAEAQRQLSSGISELNFTYQFLGPATALNALDVLLVAARREKIWEYTGVLNQAGKNPTVMDVDALAVQNAFESAYPQKPGRTIALLNIGASLTNLDIVRDGVPLFTRDLAVGGNMYTEALRKAYGLSFEEAEALKTGAAHETVTPEQRESTLASVSEGVVADIQRTLSFFRQMAGTGPIDRIFISGGTALLPALAQRMQDELKISVEILNPLQGIKVPAPPFDAKSVAGLAPRLAVAVGLALRSFDRG